MYVRTSKVREASEFRETPEVQEMICKLSEEDWKDLNKRLTLFYGYQCKRNPRWGRFKCNDLIMESVADLFVGRRRWPIEINLVQCLKGTMRSKVSHYLVAESRHTPIEDVPEASFQKTDKSYLSLQLRVELLDLVRGKDPRLRRMVELYVQDMGQKRRDMLARMPELSKKEIFNLWRQLNKVIDKLIDKLRKEQEDE